MRILFLTTALYPEETAMAHRVYLFAKLCKELGHEVYILSNGKTGYLEEKEYGGIPYKSLKVNGTSAVARYLGMKLYTRRLRKLLGRMDKPDVLFASDLENDSLVYVKEYCRQNHVGLVYDCVEWYSPEEFDRGADDPGFKKKDYQNRVLLDETVDIISISSYLHDYFSGKNCHTVRIPVLCDSTETVMDRSTNNVVRFGYAGSPGRKDRLDLLFRALERVPHDLLEGKAEFHFVGLTREQAQLGDEAASRCTFYGRLPHAETLRILKQCDFTFLFRDAQAVYAKAGFPTKCVESMNCGIPLILNYSSDLAMYLHDMDNAVVAESTDEAVIAACIEKVLQLSRQEITAMQMRAKQTACEAFDYRRYAETVDEFLHNLRSV